MKTNSFSFFVGFGVYVRSSWLSGRPALQSRQRKQHVLGADVGIAELLGLGRGDVPHVPREDGQQFSASRQRLGRRQTRLHLLPQCRGIDARVA